MNTATETDFLAELFGGSGHALTEEEHAANIAAHRAQYAANEAARKAEKDALRCPRCAGSGRLSQFSHRKGGECFLCGGSGVFAGYAA